MDSSLHLVPGRCKAAHCSWEVLEEGRSRIGKTQRINSPRPQACVRLCVLVCIWVLWLWPRRACVCVWWVCGVCLCAYGGGGSGPAVRGCVCGVCMCMCVCVSVWRAWAAPWAGAGRRVSQRASGRGERGSVAGPGCYVLFAFPAFGP